jgi:site-specific DNA-methyltransferase (adenine-specific)
MDSAVANKKLADLIPDAKNANKGTPRGQHMIEESLRAYGAGRSILIDKHGRIIAGNKTAENFGSIGMEDVLVIQTDGTKLVAVQRTDLDLDERQAQEMAIADNRAAQVSLDWDASVLKELDVDLAKFWSEDELAILLDSEPVALLTDEDDVPELPDEPKTKLGDLYVLGGHRLLCGDSTNVGDVERLMDGQNADIVFTDPPYGMNLDTDYHAITGSWKSQLLDSGVKGKVYPKVIGDDVDYDPSFLLQFFDKCKEIFMFGGDYYAKHLSAGGWFVWDKCVTAEGIVSEGSERMIGSNFELCWSKQKHKRMLARIYSRGCFGGDATGKVHPTQKPVALAGWFLDRFSEPENVVADLYGGSGSTLIACEKTARRCFMMELSPAYCDVIVTRWEAATGKKAVLNGATA